MGDIIQKEEALEDKNATSDTLPDDADDEDDDDDLMIHHQGRQIVVTAWLLVKSVSLLFGTLIQELPVEGSGSGESHVLRQEQVQLCAESLLKVLISTRHKGVLEKT